MGEIDAGIADLGEAIRFDDKQPAYYDMRGVAYLRKRDYASALADFKRAFELDPTRIDSLRNLGVAQAETGEAKLAVASFDKVLAVNPKDDKALSARGFVLHRLGEFERA
jgi:tetratricopeptide (TPR) repeat protein